MTHKTPEERREDALKNLRERVRLHVEATAGTNMFTSWKTIESEVVTTIDSLIAEERRVLREEERNMFARHIDEIMKVTSNPHELVDWLVFYRQTLITPKT